MDTVESHGGADQLGRARLVGPAVVREAISYVRTGELFMLGLPIGLEGVPDPVTPGRSPADHRMVKDYSHYQTGLAEPGLGGVCFASDEIRMSLHGTTHVDALGHAWVGNELYGGVSAATTIGGLAHGSVARLAEHGLVLPALVIDLTRQRKRPLTPDDSVSLADVLACIPEGVQSIEGWAMLIYTGWLEQYYANPDPTFFATPYREPGIDDDPQMLAWLKDSGIAMLGSDTLGNERTISGYSGDFSPLHRILIGKQGVVFLEGLWLRDLATLLDERGPSPVCLVVAPLKFERGSASPVNPVVIL